MDQETNPNNPNPEGSGSTWSLIKHGGIFAISLSLFLAFFGKDNFISFALIGGGLFLTAAVFWSGAKLFMGLVEAVGTDSQNGKTLMRWYYEKYKPSPSRKENPTKEDLIEFMKWKVAQEEAAKEKARQHASQA